jgi:hypothetical protein
MKHKILIGFAVLAIAAIAAFSVNLNTNNSKLSDISLVNVEALASESSLWFSNLRWKECPLVKVNGAVAFYYRGVLIPAYASYTYYGNKRVCEREFTTNSCHLSSETPCS